MKNKKIFISYKRLDYDKVRSIVDEIEKNIGTKCWMDIHNVTITEENFIKNICVAIDNAELILLFISENLINNSDNDDDFTIKEIRYARNSNKLIVPIRFDDTHLKGPVLFELGIANITDYNNPVQREKLYNEIKGILSSPKNNSHESNYAARKLSNHYKTIEGHEYIVKLGTLQFKMIRVEGGEMMIGATPEQIVEADSNEFPAHLVTVPTFYIGQFPVTQDIWDLVMGYNKSGFKNNKISEKYPAENMTHDEAKEFVERISKITNIKFSLPSENEWEFAARGGIKSQNHKFAGSDNIDIVAWYKENSLGKTHPVGEKKPNELGIYDMSGNVWEWTDTPAHSYAIKLENYVDLNKNMTFIRRGGSWFQNANNCRVARRYASLHSKHTNGLGLRLVIRENIK